MNTKLMRLTAAIMGLVFLLSAFACTGRPAEPGGQDAIVTAEPTAAPATNVPTTEAPATDEPTAAPTEAPEPTEEPISYWVPQAEWFIDEAFPVIERIGAVHGLRFSKADSSAQGYMQYSSDGGYRLIMNISFFRPCTALAITAYPDNFGEYTFSVGDVFIPVRFEDEEAWRASYPEEVWRDLNDLSDSARFIITPEEIAGSGCTETEGEEYLLAVGRCYQQKLAEFFRNLPENYPCSCIDMQPLDCELAAKSEDMLTVKFRLGFASLPRDLYSMHMRFYEINPGCRFADESYPAEIFGWLLTFGYSTLEKQADGSWIGTASCHDAG